MSSISPNNQQNSINCEANSNLIAAKIQNQNDEFLKKLNIAIQNSQTCVNVAAESLSTAQKLLERVDENMKKIARKEYEFFYNKTNTEVDEKVWNVRIEFHNMVNNLSLNQSPIHQHFNLSNSAQYPHIPFIQTKQPNIDLNSQLYANSSVNHRLLAQNNPSPDTEPCTSPRL